VEPVTLISLSPSLVWLRRRAVLEAVSFSKVTVADLVAPSLVTLMSVILPLLRGQLVVTFRMLEPFEWKLTRS
jgi:hypothetical protein